MRMIRDLGWLVVGVAAGVVWLLLWLPMSAWRLIRAGIPIPATADRG